MYILYTLILYRKLLQHYKLILSSTYLHKFFIFWFLNCEQTTLNTEYREISRS